MLNIGNSTSLMVSLVQPVCVHGFVRSNYQFGQLPTTRFEADKLSFITGVCTLFLQYIDDVISNAQGREINSHFYADDRPTSLGHYVKATMYATQMSTAKIGSFIVDINKWTTSNRVKLSDI